MPALSLNILVVPTYNIYTLGIVDASTYPTDPPVVVAPTIEITVPEYGMVSLPFSVDEFTVYTTGTLGITTITEDILPLPDGVYHLKYSVAPANENFVEKTFLRIDHIQERFDEAFMRLDMMECDRAIRTQAKVDLMSIYFFIQGAVSAANNCAVQEANKLYVQADKLLVNFITNNCGCSGSNFLINFR